MALEFHKAVKDGKVTLRILGGVCCGGRDYSAGDIVVASQLDALVLIGCRKAVVHTGAVGSTVHDPAPNPASDAKPESPRQVTGKQWRSPRT